MKYLYKLGLFVAGLSLVTSCTKYETLDFEVEKPESVALQEEINAYDALKTYVNREINPDFKLGAGVSMSEYIDQGVMYRLINQNFDEITAGYGMKHGAVVKDDGSLDTTQVDAFLKTADAAGLSVYGHTLVWHANQNASYLNSLLAPLIVESPAFPNALDVSGLRDGSFSGWSSTGDVSVVENEGMGEGSKAVKLTADASSSAPEDLQLISPEIPVVPDHEYEVVFYVKSDAPGEGRITFEGLGNNTPLIDWMNTGEPSETFNTGTGWKEVRFRVSDFTAESFKIKFDFGYAPGVTYYLDIENLYVYDIEGDPIINNLVANGDFETGTGWGGWGNNSTRGITEDGMGVNNEGKAFFVYNPSITGGFWEVQTIYEFPEPLENGETYNLSFWVKGDAEGVIRPELQSPDYSSDSFGQVYVTSEWQLVNLSTTVTAADRQRLIFSYGEFAGTVYLDNVSLSSASSSGGSTTIVEKTAEEKEQIIRGALENWISGMVSNSKEYVNAWDVVNEPMADGNPYELKTGEGKTLAADEFYWQDYLGKDYAVTAFKLAREYGNEDDLLFINDYNLEYNLDKTRGLIEYVEYIEDQGAMVDGIGTQMHIGIDSNKEKIAEMFRLLAATGKIIKISELDIGLGGITTDEATAEDYLAQKEMYEYVVEKYMEIVPADQRYGITIWSPTDSPEGSSWRAGEPIGLWTEDLDRKPAYTGVADGLSGIDDE